MPLFHSLPAPSITFSRRARKRDERLMNQVAQQLLFPDGNNYWVSMGNDPLVEKGAQGYNVKLEGRYEESDLRDVFTALHRAGWKVIRLKYKTVNNKTRTTIVLSEWFNTGKKDVSIGSFGTETVRSSTKPDQIGCGPAEAGNVHELHERVPS
ncbi:hypothetical protein [Pseudomonas phage D6]|nr:hypothetical protein [Pseudomonas phage D6]